MSVNDFETFLTNFVFKWESMDFTIVPGDYGGQTKAGVTQAGFDAYCLKHNLTTHSVETLTYDEIKAVYQDIWNDSSCPQMKFPINVAHFDFSVNAPHKDVNMLLQEVLGDLVVDGIIGPKTIMRLYQFDPENVAKAQVKARENWYQATVKNDKTQKQFLQGWIDRCRKTPTYAVSKDKERAAHIS